MEELRQKQIREQQNQEFHTLEKIKKKMEWIKAVQKKIQGPVFKELSNHDAAVRSGDYYMFEELDDDDELLELESVHEVSEYSKSKIDKKGQTKLTLGKLLTSAIKTDIEQAADLALSRAQATTQFVHKEKKEKLPLSPKKSTPFSAQSQITGTSGPPDSKSSFVKSDLITSAIKTDIEQAVDIALNKAHPTTLLVPKEEEEKLPLSQKSTLFSAQTQIPGTSGPPDSKSSFVKSDAPLTQIPGLKEKDEDEKAHEKESTSSIKDADIIQEKISHSSKGKPLSIDEDLQVEEKTKEKGSSCWHRVSAYIKFAWVFVESSMESITQYLNLLSKDYRFILKVLAMEKKTLKESYNFGEGLRTGTSMIWQPLPSVASKIGSPRSTQVSSIGMSKQGSKLEVDSALSAADEDEDQFSTPPRELIVPQIQVQPPSLERILNIHDGSYDDLDEKQGLYESEQSSLVCLLLALWYAIISHSELVCYFMVFLHQLKSATILSLPLPLMVLLWGTLSVPRPTKTFWVTLIAYTEMIVVVKCMFQFEILPWNQTVDKEKTPFFAPKILGIERKSQYAVYDLSLLLVIFFHRFMLKSLGLWKSTYKEENNEFEGSECEFKLEKEIKDSDLSSLHSQNDSQHEPIHVYLRNVTIPTITMNTPAGRRLSYPAPSSIIEQDETDVVEDSRRKGKDEHIIVKKEEVAPLDHCPQILALVAKRYFQSIHNFFSDLLSSTPRVTADVYAYMFICDFFNCLVVVVGFTAFGLGTPHMKTPAIGPTSKPDGFTYQGEASVAQYLKENKIPIPFLVMLILQFALIVIDRALYLRKFIFGKIIFQFTLVIGIHSFMFFILPGITDKSFDEALPPQIWYMVKCFYLLLSAYQIRSGYPTHILGNFVCKRYNLLNMCLFRGFLMVPFLFELRALMDWVWTDTSMSMFDWLKMEDIFAHIYNSKCKLRFDSEYPSPRGERKPLIVKYLMGGGLLFGIIGLIWFPLVFFAVGNTGSSNPPYDVTLTLRIGSYPALYKISAQDESIILFSEKDFAQLKTVYSKNHVAQRFLANYIYSDIAVAVLTRTSSIAWNISPPKQLRFIEDLDSDNSIGVKLTWTVSRKSYDQKVPVAGTGSLEFSMKAEINGMRNPQRDKLREMLLGPSNDSIKIPKIFPKFVTVNNHGNAIPITQLMDGDNYDETALRDLKLKKFEGAFSSETPSVQWWEVTEECDDINYDNIIKNIPMGEDCNDVIIYTFNEKGFPDSILKFISNTGIIGLYFGLVFVISKVLRNIISGLTFKIMFTEMPYVDRVLQLCLDIYLVRESGEFVLEEDLFAKLVFLYRSPETLIKWTRRREGEEQNDGQSNRSS